MPYIPSGARENVDTEIDALVKKLEGSQGSVLNYVISRLAGARVLETAKQRAEENVLFDFSFTSGPNDQARQRELLERQEHARESTESASYEDRAETLGHLTAAVAEFQRRVLDNYETIKVLHVGGRGGLDIPEYERLS